MERLWDVLLAGGVYSALDGWTVLFSATGISTDGRTIVGYGQRNGSTEAFVVVIPEPGMCSVLALGGALGVLRRRRRPA